MTNEEGRAGRSAAWGVAAVVFGAAAIATWQAAIAPKSSFPILPTYVCGGIAVIALYMCFATVWGWWPTTHAAAIAPADAAELPAADQMEDVPPIEAAGSTGPAITDRWQLTTNKVSTGTRQLQDNRISHPGYMRRSSMDNPPPSVRIGIMVACASLGPAASTSDLRAKFLCFLGQPPVMGLVRELTEISEGAAFSSALGVFSGIRVAIGPVC